MKKKQRVNGGTMKYIYSATTLISPHTNRPIANNAKELNNAPLYWCKTCCVKLVSPSSALQHVYGRPHRNKAKKDSVNQSNQSNLKHKQQLNSSNATNEQVAQEPAMKKKKLQQPPPPPPQQPVHSDPNLRCDECNLVFDSLVKSVEHFKYTRHEPVQRSNQQNNVLESTNANSDKSNAEKPVVESTAEKPTESAESAVVMKCEECKVSFLNATGAKEHFQGKKHKRLMALIEAAKQKSVLDNWQKSGTGRGLDVGARGGGRCSRFGRYKIARPAPNVLRVQNSYNSNTNPVISNNPLSTIQRNVNNGFNGFNGNSILSQLSQLQNNNYGTPHQTGNYVTPQYQASRNFGTPQCQASNYCTPQYQARNYGTVQYQSRPPQDMYNSNQNSNQANTNDSYSQTPSNAYYSSGYQSNKFSV